MRRRWAGRDKATDHRSEYLGSLSIIMPVYQDG